MGMVGEVEAGSKEDVGRYFDELDPFFREIWGEHLHHGVWREGVESQAEAARALVDLVGERLAPEPGWRVCDVGCGYGAVGAMLERSHGVTVTGITNSRVQEAKAVEGSTVLVGDWLANGLERDSFDGVVVIESLEHMADPRLALHEVARVLKPGGRVVLACWMMAADATGIERRLLMGPIIRDGRLAGLGTERTLMKALEVEGFELERIEDLSGWVARSWAECFRRAVRLGIGKRALRNQLLKLGGRTLSLGMSTKRIQFAYRIGLIRYQVITATIAGR